MSLVQEHVWYAHNLHITATVHPVEALLVPPLFLRAINKVEVIESV